MLPMSVRCLTCGEYLYKGKKFNAKKETVEGEEYLGVRIFRFYLKCTRCSGEFTIKTDPKNSDYACETGVSRNFEPWRERDQAIEEMKAKREKEEEGDAMKALENRTVDSKIEMDILDALDEIKSLNAKNAKLDLLAVLEQRNLAQQDVDGLNEEEERQIQEAFGNANDMIVRRLDDDEDKDTNSSVGGTNGLLKASPSLNKPTSNKKEESPAQPISKKQKKPLLPVISVVQPKNNNKRQKTEHSNVIPFTKPAPVVAKKETNAETTEEEGDGPLLGLVDY